MRWQRPVGRLRLGSHISCAGRIRHQGQARGGRTLGLLELDMGLSLELLDVVEEELDAIDELVSESD